MVALYQPGETIHIGRRLGVGVSGGGGGLTFLLRDDFLSDASAPLASPRTAEPGPGTLTITDTNNKLSVSSGKLSFATGGVGGGNPAVWGALLSRLAGRAVLGSVIVTTQGMEIGWDTAQSGGLFDSIRVIASTSTAIRDNNVTLDGGLTISGSTPYSVAVVQRGTGWFGFIKGGIYTNWTLVWVSATGTNDYYPGASVNASTSVGTLDLFRVLDLLAPFDTDYGLATQRLAGAQSAGQTFTHEANCVLEWVQTDIANYSRTVFRRQDASNFWYAYVDNTGRLALNEVVAGVATERASAAGVVSAGHRIVIVLDGTTIRGYSNNVLRWTYSSASNFATATSGRRGSELPAHAGQELGAVSDIISWPRTLSGNAASLLDLAVA